MTPSVERPQVSADERSSSRCRSSRRLIAAPSGTFLTGASSSRSGAGTTVI